MSFIYGSNVTLKLLIDPKTRKLVYAEAGKEFVDFLLTILSLPLGTVTKMLSKNNMVGSIGSLYKSVEDVNGLYIIRSSNHSRMSILNPKGFYPLTRTKLLPSYRSERTRQFYICSNRHAYIRVTNDCGHICVDCNQRMDHKVGYIDAANDSKSGDQAGGFVKGGVSYKIMDNLEVKTMPRYVPITPVFSRSNINDVNGLREKVVRVTSVEGLKILKASLTTEAVLSTVFLGA
ncbi:hypothetical protein LINPERHAP2_LOCUS32423 [Linum perenne]